MKGKRVMVVAAHPDDADFYCGGTVALWAKQGAEITYVICTDGALGSLNPAVGPDQIKEIRKKEQAEANRALGVKETVWLDYPDMGLRFHDTLWKQITRLYRMYRPQIVITFDPWLRYELHPDHTNAGRAGFFGRISSENRWKFPELLIEGFKPWEIQEMYLMKTDRPNVWIDVEDAIETKLAALTCHASQFAQLVSPGEQGMNVLKLMSHKHPDTGRAAEGFHHMVLTGLEGLKTYIGLV